MIVTEDSGDPCLNNLLVLEEERTYSEEIAVPAVACERRARGGDPWRVRADVVEASADESARKLSRRARESGIVSAG